MGMKKRIAPECGKGKVSEPECSIRMDQKKKKKKKEGVTVRWIGQKGRSAQKKKKRGGIAGVLKKKKGA